MEQQTQSTLEWNEVLAWNLKATRLAERLTVAIKYFAKLPERKIRATHISDMYLTPAEHFTVIPDDCVSHLELATISNVVNFFIEKCPDFTVQQVVDKILCDLEPEYKDCFQVVTGAYVRELSLQFPDRIPNNLVDTDILFLFNPKFWWHLNAAKAIRLTRGQTKNYFGTHPY